MYRKDSIIIEEWLKRSDKALLVTGARQIGKTWLFFASTNYLKMQRHFPKVAAGNSSKLHKLPEAC